MKVRLKAGKRVKTNVDTIYAELEQVREQNNGDLRPQDVVEKSRPDDAPLHPEFTWDNDAAAEKWRNEEARYLIRSIEIIKDDSPTIRAYESVEIEISEEKEQKPRNVYRRTEDILADPEARSELLASAIRDAISFRKRYNHLQEMAKIIQAIDESMLDVAI